MTIQDFRRMALSLEGAEEGQHHGNADFRVGGRIFATLAAASRGYGNVRLSLEQQAEFVSEMPHVFIPVGGGGMTHIVLAVAHPDVLEGALRAAWKLRNEENATITAKKSRATSAKATRRRPSSRKR